MIITKDKDIAKQLKAQTIKRKKPSGHLLIHTCVLWHV
jgi:hypothetical protein